MKLSEKLYQLRTERYISSQKLAMLLSVDPPMYSKIERRTRNVKIEHLQKIADFYQIEYNELHSLWAANKLNEVALKLPNEVFEQALTIISHNREGKNGKYL